MKKPKVQKSTKKDTPERLKIKKTGRDLQNALNKEKSKPMTEQDKRVINQLQGAIEEQKKKLKGAKPGMMKKPKMFTATGSAKMSPKEELAAAKKAKKDPRTRVKQARKDVRDENKSTRQATRRSNKISRVSSRLKNKQERVEKRTNKTRVQDKLDKLKMPTMKKPMMGTGTMKPMLKKPMMKKPMMGFRKKK